MENIRINQPNINPSLDTNRKKRESNQPAKNEMNRRAFLKLMGAGLTVAGAAAIGIKFNNDARESAIQNELQTLRDNVLEENRKERLEKAREYINVDDMEVIGKTFREQIEVQKDHITLDTATRKAIYHNWQEKYAPGTINYKYGIVSGLKRMRPWISEIRKIFASHGVPEEYIYLAIAESHFSSEHVSGAGAVGPYQITKETAQLDGFEIVVTNTIDERLDPLKSAELCAKHLRHNYKRFGENWDMAVLAYNGGYTDDFIRAITTEESQLPREKISSQGLYMLKEKETLSHIARRFETSITLLYRKNAPAGESFDDWIEKMKYAQAGTALEVPQKRDTSLDAFYSWLEGEMNKKIKAELVSDTYTVETGDKLEAIAKKFHMDAGLLRSINPDVHDRLLHVGQKLHIPKRYKKNPDVLLAALSHYSENINYPGKFHAIVKIIRENKLGSTLENAPKSFSEIRLNKITTLKDIAIRENMRLADLKQLNPAIKKDTLPLSIGFTIRIPNMYYLIAKEDRHKKR